MSIQKCFFNICNQPYVCVYNGIGTMNNVSKLIWLQFGKRANFCNETEKEMAVRTHGIKLIFYGSNESCPCTSISTFFSPEVLLLLSHFWMISLMINYHLNNIGFVGHKTFMGFLPFILDHYLDHNQALTTLNLERSRNYASCE